MRGRNELVVGGWWFLGATGFTKEKQVAVFASCF
jgi:hypothetical protein